MCMEEDWEEFKRKRKRELDAEFQEFINTAKRPELAAPEAPVKKKKKRYVETPLRRLRAQSLQRKKELRKIIKESTRELNAILRDLGKLKRTGPYGDLGGEYFYR